MIRSIGYSVEGPFYQPPFSSRLGRTARRPVFTCLPVDCAAGCRSVHRPLRESGAEPHPDACTCRTDSIWLLRGTVEWLLTVLKLALMGVA